MVPTGGLDLFPPDAAIAMSDYAGSLTECGVPFDVLDPAAVAERWPRIVLPEGGLALHQADTGMVHAARTVATLQRLAVRARRRAAGQHSRPSAGRRLHRGHRADAVR